MKLRRYAAYCFYLRTTLFYDYVENSYIQSREMRFAVMV